MKIQEAILSRKPFRRKSWVEDDVFCVCEFPETDFVLTMETNHLEPIELTISDILAEDWFTRDDVGEHI